VNATAIVRADLLYREAIMNVGESYGTVYMVFILIHPCIYIHAYTLAYEYSFIYRLIHVCQEAYIDPYVLIYKYFDTCTAVYA
jgi:hypothetical protein